VTAPYKILIVGDDAAFAAALAEQLAMDGSFVTALSDTAADLPDAIARHAPDLILLDAPPALCRHLREHGTRLPIVILGGSEDEAVAAAASRNAGANDHIARPLRLGPLLARLKAEIQQDARRRDADLAIGPYLFRPALKLLVGRDGGKRIRLTEKETAMLLFLVRTGTQAAPREALLEAIWGYNSGIDTHTLETHVYRLRQKIETDPANARILVTEPGGYRLTR
jgi:DNA-binding response OmpR family regulator